MDISDLLARQIRACAFATQTVVHLQGHRLDPKTARGYLAAADAVLDAFPQAKEPSGAGGIPVGTWVRNASGSEGSVVRKAQGGYVVHMEEGSYDPDQWPEGLVMFNEPLEVVK